MPVNQSPHPHRRPARSVKASLMILLLGLTGFVFLVAIDRTHWFHLRPASGTAAAMWHATADPDAPDNAATPAGR
jgi:hypothetical protein